jgi:hypothetical protein
MILLKNWAYPVQIFFSNSGFETLWGLTSLMTLLGMSFISLLIEKAAEMLQPCREDLLKFIARSKL